MISETYFRKAYNLQLFLLVDYRLFVCKRLEVICNRVIGTIVVPIFVHVVKTDTLNKKIWYHNHRGD